MAMIKCSECGKEISDKAASCPNCGAPLKREERGTYNVIITRKKQWYLINPKMKMLVDSMEEYRIENDSSITLPLTTGTHTIIFSMGPRKTQSTIEVTEDMTITVGFNRVTGEIVAEGYKIESKNNTPNISIGIGGGFIK